MVPHWAVGREDAMAMNLHIEEHLGNPWGISVRQAQALELLARLGNQQLVANVMGVNRACVNRYLDAAKRKMKTHTIGAVVIWAKWCSE